MDANKLKKSIKLYDMVIVQRNRSIYKGSACMISERGVNLRLDSGEVKFFKWWDVLSVETEEVDMEEQARTEHGVVS